tara:strand:- start:433 stop:741 length:309 start_codon:yes stop_codon:yes gene_type:complete
MLKNLLLFLSLILLSNCASPTSAFLGPIFTGAKTGSIYQASLSYGSNKLISEFKKSNISNNLSKSNFVNSNLSTKNRNPLILLAYKVDKVQVSEVLEPEPLP